MPIQPRNKMRFTVTIFAGLLTSIAIPFAAMAATTQSTGVGTISVTGTAETKVVPDSVQISVGVETTNKSATVAESENNTIINKIMTSLVAWGIQNHDVQTQQFDFQPNLSSNQSKIIGFTVSNTLNITLDQISKTGAIVDELVKDGANQINNITYTESNASQIQQSLETAAVANARTQANQIAKELGVTITGVKSVDATSNSVTPVYYGDSTNGAMMAAVPLSPGTQTISSSVTAVYTIRN